ncbi:MAG: DnaJ domain-containing protein [bacterium]
MKNRRNYYRLLQVQPDAPFEVIRASYRTLLRELQQHPDLGGDHQQALLLNEAYATLSDATRRAAYDKKLFKHYTKNPFLERVVNKQPLIINFCPFCKRPFACKAHPDERCPTCKSPLQSQSSEKLYHSCRRSIRRMQKTGSLRYYTTWPQKGREAKLIDLSPKGLRFVCSENLKPGLIIKISGAMLKASAKVINSNKGNQNGKTLYTVGVRFLTVTFVEPRGSFVATSV